MRDDLTALVSSRICHDLISPVGAIGNGVELLGGFSGKTSPELELIGESVASATARLRFFRIAFGATPDGSVISGAERVSGTDDIYDRRMTVVWQTDRADWPRLAVKIAYLALMCLEKALPLGGEITISKSGDDLMLDAVAKKVAADPAHWSHVEGPAALDSLAPASVQFAILGDNLASNSIRLKTAFTPDRAMLVFSDLQLG